MRRVAWLAVLFGLGGAASADAPPKASDYCVYVAPTAPGQPAFADCVPPQASSPKGPPQRSFHIRLAESPADAEMKTFDKTYVDASDFTAATFAEARTGNGNAAYLVGRLYEIFGDYAAALYWLHKGADGGNTKAMLMIGSHYAAGRGVAPDKPVALKWARMSADKGDLQAMFQLGRMYQSDADIGIDKAESTRWFKRAADGGHIHAMLALAACYEQGDGVAKDQAEADAWKKKADAAGAAAAQGRTPAPPPAH